MLSATAGIAGESIPSEYRSFLVALYPKDFPGVSYSNYYSEPGILAPVRLKTSRDVDRYFTLGFRANKEIDTTTFHLRDQKEKYSRVDVFPSESIISYRLMKRRESIGEIYKAIEDFSDFLRSESVTQDQLFLLMRRDLWLVVATILDMMNSSAELRQESINRLGENRKILRDAIELCLASPTEVATWRKADFRARMDSVVTLENPEVIDLVEENFTKGFVIPNAHSIHFEHNVHYAGASISHVSVWSPNEPASFFESLYWGLRGARSVEFQPMQFPPDTWTALVRFAVLPTKVVENDLSKFELIETPIIDEVILRHYFKSEYTAVANHDASDFRDVKYYQWKLAREGTYANGKFQIDAIYEDEPVFYGFHTDAPDLSSGGKLIVPMRFSCTDCHMAQSFGKNITRSFGNSYNMRLQRLSENAEGLAELGSLGGNQWTIVFHN